MAPSALVRYRPAFLVLTALLAGCSLYYLSSNSLPDSPSLRRSNAIYRRNGRLSGRDGRRHPREQRGDSLEAVQDDDTVAPLDGQDGEETVVDLEGESRGGSPDSTGKEGQDLLNLLYHVAEEQARRDGYVHRGIKCNSCNVMPIRGIRYRCANCADFDLCEQCEAMQAHPKTHVFYKVRIPAPFIGTTRQTEPLWYPGKLSLSPPQLPRDMGTRLSKGTNYEITDIEALWEQFRCLAAAEWEHDPNGLKIAIDRRTFDKCFTISTSTRPPSPNLIYDRTFAFYDTNSDGLIGFEEFIKGLAILTGKSKDERIKRIFQGYDIDNDGWVNRKDFLRMFRAFYALSKELTRDMVMGMEADAFEGESTRDIVMSSRPISSAFSSMIPDSVPSRRDGKSQDQYGNQVIVDNNGVISESKEDWADARETIADAAEKFMFGSLAENSLGRQESMLIPSPSRETYQHLEEIGIISNDMQSEPSETSTPQSGSVIESDLETSLDQETADHEWPPNYLTAVDVERAIGGYTALRDIREPYDRSRVLRAAARRLANENRARRQAVREQSVQDREHRRQFYLDDLAASPARASASRRSRSSSKVRFEDDPVDCEKETRSRSNTSISSRSIVGERWGGYEIPEAEKDVGREVIYQVTQEGFNELLDPLFKKREDLALEAIRTKAERKQWRLQILEVIAKTGSTPGEQPAPHLKADIYVEDPNLTYPGLAIDLHRNVTAFNHADSTIEDEILRKPLAALLEEAGYEVAPDNSDKISHTQTPSQPNSSIHDPTLPQNRPNAVSDNVLTNSDASAIISNGKKDKAPTLRSSPTSRLSSLRDEDIIEAPTEKPLRPRLEHLAKLDAVEAENERRGGPARINLAEFEEIMQGPSGEELAFLAGWLELANF